MSEGDLKLDLSGGARVKAQMYGNIPEGVVS